MTLQQTAEQAREHLGAARAVLSQAAVAANTTSATTGARPASPPLGQKELVSACSEASAAADALKDVNGQLQTVMPLIQGLESVPGVGDRARAQTAALQAGTQIASAGNALCDGLGPLASLLSGNSAADGSASAKDVLRGLSASRPRLLAAAQRLEELEASLGRLHEADLDPANRGVVIGLRQRLPQMTEMVRDATVLLDLLGSDRPRRYLLVSQNPDEIRATGGFIGSAGVVAAEAGGIRLIDYGSSRRFDTPPDLRAVPPPEFQQYLGHAYWNLAGANWWSSFPDVARQLAYFYSLSQPGSPVDGVVAVDQFGLQHLLEVLGPVDVPEYGERVSADNVEAELDHYVHAGDASDELGRKQFTAALSTAVLEAVLNAPREALPGLVKAARASLDEQHLLVWVPDPDAAQFFAHKRWDGALLPASGDSLMLLDTDVVASKQSQAVSRDAAYSVSLRSDGRARAALSVTYTNHARPEQRPDVQYVPNYRTLLRVLAPAGAQLVSSSGFVAAASQGDECGRRVFAGEVSIPEGASTSVNLVYDLPASIIGPAGYDLLVQQQPGVPPGQLSVSVSTAPDAVARAELSNTPGQHAHWRLDSSSSPALRNVPLPEASIAGCGMPLVQAAPIAPPTELEIPAANIQARVVDLGVQPDGQMEAPPTPDVVGWYRMSGRPGQPGNTVMSGHVDWGRNTAVFWGLRDLRPGDAIVVRGGDGIAHTYAVEWNQTFSATGAPVDRIVGPSKDSLLTLITCDGTFDPRIRQYLERRIVRARLVDEPTPR
jgi:sortase (surface protein transpeptidase)